MVTSADAAARLGVGRSTIARLVRAGHLTPVMKAPGIRGAFVFDQSEVDALAASRAKAASA